MKGNLRAVGGLMSSLSCAVYAASDDLPDILPSGFGAGIEYVVPIDAWKNSDPPTVMGHAMKRFDRAGFFYLHVWIWEHSPSGLFSDWNPRVKCATAQ
jgi:hypothetical protein